ncbi:MAG: hypothetical protein RL693_1803 [Verrucomicrobiota bacterium]|jgi:hypothetical protein
MKEENGNSAGVWITVAIGVVMLYMLSPGPVAVYYNRRHQDVPEWVQEIYWPINKLFENSKTVDMVYRAYFKALGVK